MGGVSKKVLKLTIFDDVFAEEDPTGSEQGSEAEQKSDEKPNTSSTNAKTSVCEGFASKLAVRDSVDPVLNEKINFVLRLN